MNSTARTSLIGAGIGAGLMFMLDPQGGGRRRALVRDKFVRAAHKTREAAGATRRDVSNRLTGLAAEANAMWTRDEPSDRVICERVRAELGRVSKHPGAILVNSQNGCVTLAGDVLADELSSVLSAASNVRGVDRVQDNMAVHADARGVAALQGSGLRKTKRTSLVAGWSPTAMLIAGAATAATAALAVGVASRRAA